MGDQGAGLGAVRCEVEAPEAQIVQQDAAGGVLKEGVVDDMGEAY